MREEYSEVYREMSKGCSEIGGRMGNIERMNVWTEETKE
jgi:hypothetical protein